MSRLLQAMRLREREQTRLILERSDPSLPPLATTRPPLMPYQFRPFISTPPGTRRRRRRG